jgi:hypothetical protein
VKARALEQRRRTAEAYKQARAQVDRVDKAALSPMAEWFELETGRVTTMLGRHFKGRLKEKFEPQYLAPLKGRLQAHFGEVARRLEGRWVPEAKGLLADGVGGVTSLVSKLSGREPPAGLTERVTTKHLTELERRRTSSARGLAQELGSKTWSGLKASFEKETRASDLVALSGELMDQQAWKVDRLVRTEASYGYNLAQAAALKAFPTEPGSLLWGRWTERVDDLSGRPLDDKVGLDSLVLHGQVARPGGVFTMPDDHRAPARLIGQSWAHPPNRPNDRAVLLPWQRDWGVSGWILQANRRIDLAALDPGRAVGILG